MERRENTIKLSQERFTVHFENPPALEWQIPLTYAIEGQATPNGFLLRSKTADLPDDVPNDHAVKLNVGDSGYYRMECDETSWKLIVNQLRNLSEADRVNLLADARALVEANHRPLSHYLGLVEKGTQKDDLAVYDQIGDTFAFINRLLAGDPERPGFQQCARAILRPAFDRVGWDPKRGEAAKRAFLRASLIRSLGLLNDGDIIAGCRSRFDRFLTDPTTVPPDLRREIFAVVGRYADLQTWEKLHKLGLKTTSTEEKQIYYEALGSAIDPKLAQRTLAIALTDELPTSRASAVLPFSARQGEHPELVWEFAKAHMKALLAKQDALGINSYAAGLFNFFSDAKDAETLETYAKSSLPPSATKAVAKTVDEIGFRAEFKQRFVPQFKSWIEQQANGTSR